LERLCHHHYEFTQGHFYCIKGGHRTYGQSRRRRRNKKIGIAIILGIIIVVFIFGLFFGIINLESFENILEIYLETTKQKQENIKQTEFTESIEINHCILRSDRNEKVLINCGDYGNAEFRSFEPIKSTIVDDVALSKPGANYLVTYSTAQVTKSYELRKISGSIFPFSEGNQHNESSTQSEIELLPNLIPEIELPELDLDSIILFIEPLIAPEFELPEVEFPDVSFEPTPTSVEESQKNLEYINQLRQEKGRSTISFDKRAYDLALARVQDLIEYDYFDHTNPITGSCPDNMKKSYGFSSHEYPAENLASGTYSANSAVDLWMTSQGHRYNLLYSDHKSGATVCLSGECAFLGVNSGGLGMGCYTGQQGKAWQENMGDCSDEDFLRLDNLNREYEKYPKVIQNPSQYKKATDLYNQIINFKC